MTDAPISTNDVPWRDRPEQQEPVRVKGFYWIDPGTSYQLAHLVPEPVPDGVHEADAVCERERPLLWPLVGEGQGSVPRHRTCLRCMDLMAKTRA
jgi:hypothetical protein